MIDIPDMPSVSTVRIYVDGDNGWPTLPPHQVMALARWHLHCLKYCAELEAENEALRKGYERLKARDDAGFDAGYRILAAAKEWLDSFNVLCHRTTLDDRRQDSD